MPVVPPGRTATTGDLFGRFDIADFMTVRLGIVIDGAESLVDDNQEITRTLFATENSAHGHSKPT